MARVVVDACCCVRWYRCCCRMAALRVARSIFGGSALHESCLKGARLVDRARIKERSCTDTDMF